MSKEKFTEEQFFDSGKVIKDGVEWPETTPVELPIGYSHPPSIQEMLRVMVQQELQMRDEMGDDDGEAEREEDFSLDEEEEELLTPYELHAAAAEEMKILESRGLIRNKKSGRIEERANKGTLKEREDGIVEDRVGDDRKRFGSGGEERAEVGGERGSARSGGDGVSQVQRGGGGAAKAGSARAGKDVEAEGEK